MTMIMGLLVSYIAGIYLIAWVDRSLHNSIAVMYHTNVIYIGLSDLGHNLLSLLTEGLLYSSTRNIGST